MKKIRISELPLYSSLKGLFTIGTDNQNRSVKVSLEFIETETSAAVKNAEEATAAAKTATAAADTAKANADAATQGAKEAATASAAQTALSKTATDNAVSATERANTATAATERATKEANTATEAAKAATGVTEKATSEANAATAKADTATADLRTWLGSILPTGLDVKCLKRITIGNLNEKKIEAVLSPDNVEKNVIFISDNKSVAVDPFGRITVVGTGKSTVHVIPTLNTSLAKSVVIEVGSPTLRKVKAKSLRFTSTGAMRFN